MENTKEDILRKIEDLVCRFYQDRDLRDSLNEIKNFVQDDEDEDESELERVTRERDDAESILDEIRELVR